MEQIQEIDHLLEKEGAAPSALKTNSAQKCYSDVSTPKIAVNVQRFYNNISDYLSSKYHSQDFKQTRNQLIINRLRFMCLLFAIMVPLSTLFDYFLFSTDFASLLLVKRGMLSASLFSLYFLCRSEKNIFRANVYLAFSFLLPTLFFLSVDYQFYSEQLDMPLAMAMVPYLIVSVLGLFPLTFRAGIVLLITVSLPITFYYVFINRHDFIEIGQQLWMVSLFGGIALWLQLGQLMMLMKLYRESTVDPLTGLINRRVLIRQLEQMEKDSIENSGKTFSVMILDLDRFKRINDNYGHQTGDRVLMSVSDCLRQQIGRTDIAARFGGEEFVLVLADMNLQQAKVRAQDICAAIRLLQVHNDAGEALNVTTSIGLCQFTPEYRIHSLLQKADERLYEAKNDGRDQVKF